MVDQWNKRLTFIEGGAGGAGAGPLFPFFAARTSGVRRTMELIKRSVIFISRIGVGFLQRNPEVLLYKGSIADRFFLCVATFRSFMIGHSYKYIVTKLCGTKTVPRCNAITVNIP